MGSLSSILNELVESEVGSFFDGFTEIKETPSLELGSAITEGLKEFSVSEKILLEAFCKIVDNEYQDKELKSITKLIVECIHAK